MRVEFQKVVFWKETEKLAVFRSLFQPFGIIMTMKLGTFVKSSFLVISGQYGNGDRYKNYNFSFRYIFATSMTVESFITKVA